MVLSNQKRVGFATFAIIATVFIVTRAQAPTPVTSGTRHAFAQKLSLEGVPVFAQVTPTLYRGAQPTEEGFRNLAEMGVKIVVDQRGSRSEREQVTKLGMQYVAIPWHCPLPEDTVFARFLTLLRGNPGAKVFIHCLSGEDRTGMQIAAYPDGRTGLERPRGQGRDGGIWFLAHSSLEVSEPVILRRTISSAVQGKSRVQGPPRSPEQRQTMN